MIRFMSDTRYAGLEKEMQHIPGFCPRRSGMVISHLSDCLENQRSPCERLVTDYVPFYELLLEPGGIDHSESSRNNQSELIRNSQCTCLAN